MTRASLLTATARTAHMAMWSESATYKQGGTGTGIAITARKAAVKTVSASGEDVVVSTEWFDWVVTASELAVATVLFEPDIGDTVTVAQADGKTAIYQVGTYGSEKCWEPADTEEKELVIHTKLWSEA